MNDYLKPYAHPPIQRYGSEIVDGGHTYKYYSKLVTDLEGKEKLTKKCQDKGNTNARIFSKIPSATKENKSLDLTSISLLSVSTLPLPKPPQEYQRLRRAVLPPEDLSKDGGNCSGASKEINQTIIFDWEESDYLLYFVVQN